MFAFSSIPKGRSCTPRPDFDTAVNLDILNTAQSLLSNVILLRVTLTSPQKCLVSGTKGVHNCYRDSGCFHPEFDRGPLVYP